MGVMAGWASATLYNSDTFSQRAGNLLRSPAIRHEIAARLTDQLAAAGNDQAVNFRPAFQLAVDGAIDTEAFRSIFRTAVRSTHHALLAGGAKGIDLSQALSVIATTLQLPNNARPGQKDATSLGSSFESATKRMADLHVWQIEGWAHSLWLLGTFGGLAAGAAAIAVASDRRRMVARLGWVLVADGAVIAGAVLAVQWYAGHSIADNTLAAAVRDAVGRWTGDLRSIGLWMAGYGVVLAAAAAAVAGRVFTPARVTGAIGGWIDRRRATTAGTVEVGAVAVLVGLVLIRYHEFWSLVAVLGAGLWLAYLGAAELMGLVRRVAPTTSVAGHTTARGRRLGLVTAVAVVLLAIVSVGLVVTTRGATQRAEAEGVQRCNGSAALCDLPLNKVMIPATHNSMSSERYPGWMFAEHIQTIGQQLDSGVRALLIDTHYGIPSTARMLGSRNQLVVTDRAHELVRPSGEQADSDPNVVAKAQSLAAGVPPAARAARGVYLCHNWCEMGAIRFSEGLAEVKSFLDTHPDEVVTLDIEDHTTPADTAGAIEKSGLARRAWTLDPARSLPTLGEMIGAGKNLLVLAEGGGPGAPPWYQPAYEHWVQETEYTWPTRDSMDCRPKRGPADAPLFLVNHWVEAAPPSPKTARAANQRDFLEARLRRCFAERGQIPNLVAVDFSAMGDLMSTVRDLNDAFVDQLAAVRRSRGRPAPTAPSANRGVPRPPTAPLAPVPVSITPEVTTFTGGDPTGFCSGWTSVEEVIGAWAEARLMAASSQEEGLADLAYGEGAAQALDAVADVAPAEVVQALAPTLSRAQAAVDAVRALGADDATIDQGARAVIGSSAGGTEADGETPATLEADRTQFLRATFGADRVNAAARAFAQSHPPEAGLFDLGNFSAPAARTAGYDCLASSDQ
jgi:hypothetical protein